MLLFSEMPVYFGISTPEYLSMSASGELRNRSTVNIDTSVNATIAAIILMRLIGETDIR